MSHTVGWQEGVFQSQALRMQQQEEPMHERMMDKTNQPSDEDMINWIGQPIAKEWIALRRFLTETYDIAPIFNSGGKRYGWNLQYRLAGRPLCEIYPEHGSFTALVILGQVELQHAMDRLKIFGSIVQQALTDTP
jgi:AraC family transcriptional regulator